MLLLIRVCVNQGSVLFMQLLCYTYRICLLKVHRHTCSTAQHTYMYQTKSLLTHSMYTLAVHVHGTVELLKIHFFKTDKVVVLWK